MEWRVSAILTTYNRPELAKRALQSILNQTMEADEIIVVEDSGHGNLSDWIRGLGNAPKKPTKDKLKLSKPNCAGPKYRANQTPTNRPTPIRRTRSAYNQIILARTF